VLRWAIIFSTYSYSDTAMYIDIAANLTDDMFSGIYHGKPRHEPDLDLVLQRAADGGCSDMIVLAGSLKDAEKCEEICRMSAAVRLYSTIGIHPTRCDTVFEHLPESSCDESIVAFLDEKFSAAVKNNNLVSIGELGLDYDRLQFCPMEVQKRIFRLQLRAAAKTGGLPLLLHLRNAVDDFIAIMESEPWTSGVVHSFDGSRTEMEKLVKMGLFIGLNGCSLRSETFLTEVVPNIPEDRILFETDSPYCEIKPTHPGYMWLRDVPRSFKAEKFVKGELVKNRNEPACINQVAQIVAKARGQCVISLSENVRNNTLRLFTRMIRV
jgi:TatD DNase family protein